MYLGDKWYKVVCASDCGCESPTSYYEDVLVEQGGCDDDGEYYQELVEDDGMGTDYEYGDDW